MFSVGRGAAAPAARVAVAVARAVAASGAGARAAATSGAVVAMAAEVRATRRAKKPTMPEHYTPVQKKPVTCLSLLELFHFT